MAESSAEFHEKLYSVVFVFAKLEESLSLLRQVDEPMLANVASDAVAESVGDWSDCATEAEDGGLTRLNQQLPGRGPIIYCLSFNTLAENL